jgi:hypothetical protein
MLNNENRDLPELLPQWIVDEMVSFLYTNGLVMKDKTMTSAIHVPVTVFPTPVIYKFINNLRL